MRRVGGIHRDSIADRAPISATVSPSSDVLRSATAPSTRPNITCSTAKVTQPTMLAISEIVVPVPVTLAATGRPTKTENQMEESDPQPGLYRQGGDLDAMADESQTAPWIADALGRLSARHLQVVQLVDIDGLTYGEAAAALGIPAGTVMSRLHRARRRMRAHLAHDSDFRSEHR